MPLPWTKSARDKIFVNYRRSDAQGFAGRLADSLTQHFGAEPFFNPLQGGVLAVGFGIVRADQLKPWRQPVRSGQQARNLGILPGDRSVIRQAERFGRRASDLAKTFGHDRPQRRDGGRAYGLALKRLCGRGRLEMQADKFADDVAFNSHFAIFRQFGH